MADESGIQKIGVQAVFDNANFKAGSDEYNAGMARSSRVTDEATKTMADDWAKLSERLDKSRQGIDQVRTSLSDRSRGIDAALKTAHTSTQNFSTALMALGAGAAAGIASAGVGLVVEGFNSAIGAISGAKDAVIGFIEECAKGKAREEELGLAAQFMGQQAGLSATQVDNLLSGLEQMGATGDTAGEAIAKFAQHSLDATQATDLFRLAQGASIISGEGVQSTYLGLIDTISTLRTRGLKQLGLNIDLAAAETVYAQSLGKTKDQLTEDEQSQALLNATLQQGTKLMGLYAEGIKLPAAQMRRLSGSLMPELLDAIGAPFQDALSNSTQAMSYFVKGLTNALNEGGALYPIMVKIGTIASFLSEGLLNLAKVATDVGIAFASKLGVSLTDVASNALDWGVNIAVQLANGIMQGAADAIVAAMNFVSNLLFGWLSPGSPPKIVPNIDKWGAAAIGEWLQGFTMADFSTLEAIQSPLQKALEDAFGKSGKEASAAFAKLSGEILSAIDAGAMSDALYNEIAGIGELGPQLAILTKDQVALAAATKESEAAQKALTDSQKAASAAQSKVSSLIRQYNAMLRGGAGKEALDAKMAEIRAAEKERDLAQASVSEAQTSLDTAQEKAAALKEQTALQAALVSQQQKLAKAESATAGGGAGGGGAGGGAGGGGLKVPSVGGGGGLKTPDLSGLGKGIGDAIDAAKGEIQSKWNSIWDGMVEKASGLWERISPAWDRLRGGIQGVLDSLNNNIVQPALTWLQSQWEQATNGIQQWLQKHGSSVQTILGSAYQAAQQIVTIAVAYIRARWNDFLAWPIWQIMGDNLTTAWEGFKRIVSDAADAVGNILDAFAALSQGNWEDFWAAMRRVLENVGDALITLVGTTLETILHTFGTSLDSLFTNWDFIFSSIRTIFSTWWTDIQQSATNGMRAVSDAILGAITTAQTDLSNLGKNFSDIGTALITALKDGIVGAAQGVVDAATGVVNSAITAAQNALGMHSPPKVFIDMGRASSRAFGAGMKQESGAATQASVGLMARATAPLAMAPILTGNSSSTTVNMGGVSIYNPMQLAQFESMLTRVLKGAQR